MKSGAIADQLITFARRLCQGTPIKYRQLSATAFDVGLDNCVLQWNHDGLCTNGGNFNADYAALLSDLQNFLATQHLDPTALQDLKSWISQLPVDANTISEFENWLQTLGTYCNDTVGVETESSKSVGTNLSLADQSVTAVPEPSTTSTFILGIGLLGGVLLRLRPAR